MGLKKLDKKKRLERTALIPQYSILINTSSGALPTASQFLTMKAFCQRKMSARNPAIKVIVARLRAIIL